MLRCKLKNRLSFVRMIVTVKKGLADANPSGGFVATISRSDDSPHGAM